MDFFWLPPTAFSKIERSPFISCVNIVRPDYLLGRFNTKFCYPTDLAPASHRKCWETRKYTPGFIAARILRPISKNTWFCQSMRQPTCLYNASITPVRSCTFPRRSTVLALSRETHSPPPSCSRCLKGIANLRMHEPSVVNLLSGVGSDSKVEWHVSPIH